MDHRAQHLRPRDHRLTSQPSTSYGAPEMATPWSRTRCVWGYPFALEGVGLGDLACQPLWSPQPFAQVKAAFEDVIHWSLPRLAGAQAARARRMNSSSSAANRAARSALPGGMRSSSSRTRLRSARNSGSFSAARS